ncbi:tetratricopeptide repeat protein [Croceitalea rosinachiae]|uniref:Tetratricopeptide repeat protein n=1 Tax=Croceitalea rosinachiae TaxID=3075596 RepID=A0ABU3AEG7_9FLAO|nr:tetratricopeptide repeat protein [Croceitalea sp. F388]MDT0608575.1 tetratricopeptide repeat protein [Croceitalea sp. F388]
MKTSIFLFIILFSFCFCISAQENQKLDSLLSVYKQLPNDTSKVFILGELYDEVITKDVDKARAYAMEQLNLSKKIGFKMGMANAYFDLGDYYKNRSHIDSASLNYNMALDIFKSEGSLRDEIKLNYALSNIQFEKGEYDKALDISLKNLKKREVLKDSLGLAIEYNFVGGLYEYKGEGKKAYEYIFKALSIYDKIDKPLRKADALNGLGSLEGSYGEYEKSNEYTLQALEIYRAHDDKLYQAVTCNAVGQNYIDLKDYEEAKKYLKESIALSKEVKNSMLEGGASRNMGRAYAAEENYEDAIFWMEKAVKIHRETTRPVPVIRSLFYLGKAYNANGQYANGLETFNECMELAKVSANSPGFLFSIHRERAQSQEGLKNYPHALTEFKEYKRLSDTVFEQNKIKQIEELRTIYDTEKKEQQIVLQDKEITVLEQKAEISSLQKILLGGLLVLSLFGFYGIRQKLKRNKLEKEKVDAELAFKKKELTTHALNLARKNEVLESLKQKAQELKENEESKKGYQQLIRTINFDLQDDNNWENFSRYFEEVHKDFNSNVKTKYPQVTSNELRLLALLKMNLSSKEIANILNISAEGIKKARYRLRKKLDITTEDSLQDLVLSL